MAQRMIRVIVSGVISDDICEGDLYRGFSYDSIARRIWGAGAYVSFQNDEAAEIYKDTRGVSEFMGWLILQ